MSSSDQLSLFFVRLRNCLFIYLSIDLSFPRPPVCPLGHFLLTELLLPLIAETSTFGAVINIASTFHYQVDMSIC